MNTNYIHVFTDADLDGAISYLTLCWYLGRDLPVTVTTENQLVEDYKKFRENKNLQTYKRVYIFDLDICKLAPELDKPNFSIVDHHIGSIECGYNFTHARHKIEDSGSTCKLLYEVLKNHYKRDLTKEQKILISIGHDYDSYTLKQREISIGLNIIFWNLQGNRLEKFIEKFKNGFTGFSEEDKKIISFYNKKIDNFLNDTNVFVGVVPIGGRNIRICSVMADFCINEIAQAIINKTDSEVGIVVNPKTQSISFRRRNNSNFNVANLAKKIADGGGHPAAAGGKITNTFLEFTKLLKQ